MSCREGISEPTFEGRAGRAWLLDAPQTRSEHAAHLVTYLLEAKEAHPFWDCYVVCCVHLRDIPGTLAPHKKFDSATHEIMVWALDPARDGEHDGVKIPESGLALLTPQNLVEQVELPSDQMAFELLRLLVRSFVNGQLSPDTDFRTLTKAAIQATTEHLRAGRHGFV